MNFFFVFVIIFSVYGSSESFLDSVKEWLFGDDTSGKTLVRQSAKFEVVSTDEKFLKFASALADLSPLDACYHIVVFSLKKKCGELSEEDLGKLAVQLLNCQSEAENRPTFRCTQEMTIAQCTEHMDGPTWNAYQIVGNRARAMCYASQQHQFRKMTEMAVNDLATAALNQIQSLEQLKHGQEMLHGLTTETVRKLFESQQELLGTHQQLRIAHKDVMNHVTDNVDALVKEKSLISAGNKQLAEMIENIKVKLDHTAQRLTDQTDKQEKNHEKISKDLNKIHQKAQDALHKLDESATRLLENHREMTRFYQQMYGNVVKINSSVSELMTAVNNMQVQLEKKISWFTQVLGSSEDKLNLILLIGQHAGYYFLLMMLVAYIKLPRLSRLLVLVASIVNGTLVVKYQNGFTFQEVTCAIAILIIANVMYHIWRPKQRLSNAQPNYLTVESAATEASTEEDMSEGLTASELQTLQALLNKAQNIFTANLQAARRPTERAESETDTVFPPRPDSSTPEDYDHVRRYISNHFDGQSSRHSTPQPGTSSAFMRPMSRGSTPSKSSNISHRCFGVTRSGTPCRLSSQPGYRFCHKHRRELS